MENIDICPICSEIGCFEMCFDKMYHYYLENYPEFVMCKCEEFFNKRGEEHKIYNALEKCK